MKRSFCPALAGSAAVLMIAGSVQALDNGVARTPPMGWNTFNQFGGEWNINTIKAVTDSLVSSGLKNCGYIYVNCDGNDGGDTPYWPGHSGFVNWAKPFADYVHGKGMKLGVYTSVLSNPQATAGDLAAAQVDFIKIDAWTTSGSSAEWKAMSDALVACGRPIVFSAHNGGRTLTPATTNMNRTGRDIEAEWSVIMEDFDANYFYLSQEGPGSWADPDMMETGCRADGGFVLTAAEDRASFSMWCMMASPLIIGYDVSQTNSWCKSTPAHHVQTIAILSNTELIAVDQDPLGKGGKRIKGQNAMEVWTKDLQDGSKAVAFFNRTGSSGTGSITQAELGLTGTIYVRDLWQHKDLPQFSSGSFSASVASHAAEVYRMSTKQITAVAELREMDRSIAWLKKNGFEVFPERMAPSVLAGMIPAVKAFDVRGRAATPGLAGAGVFVLRDLTPPSAPLSCQRGGPD